MLQYVPAQSDSSTSRVGRPRYPEGVIGRRADSGPIFSQHHLRSCTAPRVLNSVPFQAPMGGLGGFQVYYALV